jgi:hypothetical protein
MDMHSQLRKILHMIEAFKVDMHDHLQGIKASLQDHRDSYHNSQRSLTLLQERYLMENTRDEYN